jgi:hypothetical protein
MGRPLIQSVSPPGNKSAKVMSNILSSKWAATARERNAPHRGENMNSDSDKGRREFLTDLTAALTVMAVGSTVTSSTSAANSDMPRRTLGHTG